MTNTYSGKSDNCHAWLRLKSRKDGNMEVKDVLGEEMYKQVQAKIDEQNSKEEDKLSWTPLQK